MLVNNVGAVRARVDGFRSVTDDDWETTFQINFFSTVRMARAALPQLLAAGAGSIVTVSSVNAVLPDPGIDSLEVRKGSVDEQDVAVFAGHLREPGHLQASLAWFRSLPQDVKTCRSPVTPDRRPVTGPNAMR